ncbi:protein sym-1 [Typha angustifolia]|uniref:protein sym-1 n=1 Tax=Typha angustifolia TaxID=59011 RepID=UPI003C2F41AE
MAAIFHKYPLAATKAISFPPNPVSSRPNVGSISPNLGQNRVLCLPCHSIRAFWNSTSGFGFGIKGPEFGPYRAIPGGGSGGEGGGGRSGDGSSGGGGGGGGDGGGSESGGNDNFLFSWYLMALDKHPVITKAITSSILNLIGDLICQLLINKVSKLDVRRTIVSAFLGLVLVGPTLHIWYLYLSKLVTISGASGAFVRLLLDQSIFSPIFIGVFMASLVTLEGRPSHVVPKLRQEWFSAVIANWQLWIPFQFLNFRFVPQQFQVLVANIVALAWNVILSFKAHKEVVLK